MSEILTDDISIFIHHHGSTHVDLHDLRDTHKYRLYFDILVTSYSLPSPILSLLETS